MLLSSVSFLVQEVKTVTSVSTSDTSSTIQVRVNTVPEYGVPVEGSTGDPVKLIVGSGTVENSKLVNRIQA